MNNLKKIAALLLAGAVTVGGAVSAFAFTDMPDGEMGIAIENAVNNGLLTGMSLSQEHKCLQLL